jgi:hypothetical protein
MKYSDFVSGIFWIAIGILLTLWSTRYEFGSIIQPGPGFLPLTLGILLIFLSIILLGQTIKSSLNGQTITAPSARGAWKKVAYAVLILLLASFMFEKIGYLLTIFLMIILLMCEAALRSWKTILLVAFISAIGVYLVFVLLLKQPLPHGLLRI